MASLAASQPGTQTVLLKAAALPPLHDGTGTNRCMHTPLHILRSAQGQALHCASVEARLMGLSPVECAGALFAALLPRLPLLLFLQTTTLLLAQPLRSASNLKTCNSSGGSSTNTHWWVSTVY